MPSSQCGFGVAPLPFPDDLALGGYSIAGKIGRADPDEPLQIRAVFLEGSDGNVAAIIVAELWTASVGIQQAIAQKAASIDSRLSEANIVVAGVHTHSAPGRFMGSKLFNVLAQAFPKKPSVLADVDDPNVTTVIVNGAIAALSAARGSSQPAVHSFVQGRIPAVSRNRSLKAFLKNEIEVRDWHLPGHPGEGLESLADKTQRYVDARLPMLAFWSETGDLLGALATFSCHATTLHTDQETYNGDWPAIAASFVEGHLIVPILIGLGGAGDVTPLPPENTED
jgi:hypothetical protein